MVRKSFDLTVAFVKDQNSGLTYPIVEVNFLTIGGRWETLPLLFDTGCSEVVLRPTYAPLFPPGVEEGVNTVGSQQPRKSLVTKSRIELFGLIADCEIVLVDIPANPLFAGLLGRACFMPFGFGFWESRHELYVTLKP